MDLTKNTPQQFEGHPADPTDTNAHDAARTPIRDGRGAAGSPGGGGSAVPSSSRPPWWAVWQLVREIRVRRMLRRVWEDIQATFAGRVGSGQKIRTPVR